MIKFWRISHDADVTETGCTMGRTYVKTEWEGFPLQEGHEVDILSDFCFKRFGEKTAYVQGVAPCSNWDITEITEDEYCESKPVVWGGYRHKPTRIELGIGNRGTVRIISESEVEE